MQCTRIIVLLTYESCYLYVVDDIVGAPWKRKKTLMSCFLFGFTRKIKSTSSRSPENGNFTKPKLQGGPFEPVLKFSAALTRQVCKSGSKRQQQKKTRSSFF